MLRGINVSGHKPVKMERLRVSFAALGFASVRTYLQSGNVIFESAFGSVAAMSEKIARKLELDFGFSIPVLVRTRSELGETLKLNPFLKEPAIDHSKLHVTLLADAPPKTAPEQLQPLAVKPDRFHIIGRQIYLRCPDGYGRTKLSNVAIEKKLGIGATTRNWKTVNALFELTG